MKKIETKSVLAVDLKKVAEFKNSDAYSQAIEKGFRENGGSTERLTAGVTIAFPSDAMTTVEMKSAEIGGITRYWIAIDGVSCSNNADSISIAVFQDFAQFNHLGTDKVTQAYRIKALLANQTVKVKSVWYDYILNTKTNEYFGVRHVEIVDENEAVTPEEIAQSNANVEAFKNANGNQSELANLYNQQHAEKPSTTAKAARKTNKKQNL